MTTILDLPIEILIYISTFIRSDLFWKFFRDSNKYFKINLPSRSDHYGIFHAMLTLEKAGHQSCVKSFLENNKFFHSGNRYRKFIKNGYLGCFEYLITEKQIDTNVMDFIRPAVQFCQFYILSKLWQHTHFPRDQICIMAVESNQLPVLQWARAFNLPWGNSFCSTLVNEGNLKILEWVVKNNYPEIDSISRTAAKKGNLEILDWYFTNHVWDDSICIIAAENCEFKVLEWIKKNNFSWNAGAYGIAKIRHNDNVVKWIIQNDYPYDVSDYLNTNCPLCLCIIDEKNKTTYKKCKTCSYNGNDVYCSNCTNCCDRCKKTWCKKCNVFIECKSCRRRLCIKCMSPRCVKCYKVKCCRSCMKDYQCPGCLNIEKSKEKSKLKTKKFVSANK